MSGVSRSKKNIILLHGWGVSSEKLETLARNFGAMRWNIINLRLPGFDLAQPKRSWSVVDYAKYVINQASKEFLRQKYFIFGHSFGGRIAIMMASMQTSNLEGIILCATGGLSKGNLSKRFIFLVLAKVGKVLTFWMPAAHFYRKLLYRAAREHDYERATGTMKETLQRVVAEDLKPNLAKIKLPTLILWGRVDKVTPLKDGIVAKNGIKKSELIIFDDEGHGLPYQKPKAVVEEVEKWYLSLK